MSAFRKRKASGAPRRRGPYKKRRVPRRPNGRNSLNVAGQFGAVEKKFVDVGVILTSRTMLETATATNVLNSAVNVPQGTSQSQRIGRKVVLVNLRLKGELHIVGTAAAPPDELVNMTGRLVLFIDHQNNGSALITQPADLFNLTVTGSGTAPNLIHAFANLENQHRYTFLYDKLHVMTPENSMATTISPTTGEYFRQRNMRFHKKCFIPLEYNTSGTGGDSDSLASNCIKMMFLTDIPPANSSKLLYHGILRGRYIDN